MKPADLLASRLLSSKLGIHALFCLTFVTIFSIPVVLSGNQGIGLAAIFCCLYILICTYLGRWFGKLLSARRLTASVAVMVIATFSVWTILGAIGAGLLFRGNAKQHFFEYLAICFPLAVLFSFLGISISLVRSSLLRQLQDAHSREQQKQSELDLLVSQLSPHFLFNTLNNIYGLSITQHHRVPALLIKLSELLRYSLYQTKQPFIPVSREIAYIRNYIHFERIQTDAAVTFEDQIADVTDESLLIAPMLLIVFVENAFKHSLRAQLPSPKIMVKLILSENWLYFEVRNSCMSATGPVAGSPDSGMGLNHTLRRLELIYPGNFRYQAEKQDNEYQMHLALKMITP